ncbi:MAG: NAD-dependent epimerase/dehydratase family protein [Acidimicrobiales bacterium]
MTSAVTVVVPTIPPRTSLLARAFASIAAQTTPPEATVVTIDHARQGHGPTRTRAMQRVTTDWIAFLDDDDELFDDPHRAVQVNVEGTLNVLEAARTVGAGYTGITMPQVNPSLYSATKNCGQAMAEAYRQAHDLPVSHVIAYNAFGPGQAYGPGHPQKILPTFAMAAWSGQPIPVWGDGQLWTDLVHVDDVARMLVDSTRFGDGEIFDAGTGVPLTVLEVAAAVHEVAGDTGVAHMPHRPGERRVRTNDDYANHRGWHLLDWRPERDEARWVEAIESYRHAAVEAAA